MEENKSCAHGDCEKCKDGKTCCGGHKCCGMCHHSLKILGAIILLIAAFCLGAMFGREGNSYFREHNGGQRFTNKTDFISPGETGSVTVKVLPSVGTTTPQVKP